MTQPLTVPEIFAAAAATEPTRPLITFYDDGTGERTELSGVTLVNWLAKTANLLVDGSGLGPGETAAVRLPAHWQTAVVLLGAWAAGLSVDFGGTGPESALPAVPEPAVAFVTAELVDKIPATETFALGLAPMALPLRPGPPPGSADFVLEVRAFGDRFTPAEPVRPDWPALHQPAPGQPAGSWPVLTHAELVAAATSRATAAGMAPGGRLLIDADAHPDPVDWLLAPLAAGASIVLCRGLEPARVAARLATERATLPDW